MMGFAALVKSVGGADKEELERFRWYPFNPQNVPDSICENRPITGQNAFETTSRKPDLTRVRGALLYQPPPATDS